MKLIEVIADSDYIATITGAAEHHGALDYWLGPLNEDGRQACRMLVPPDSRQPLLDELQEALSNSENARIVVHPIEVTLPRPEQEEAPKEKLSTTREELYNDIEKGARLDLNFIALALLSTLVAAIGLLENNTAVVIGAMVIAPLLGPNIAFALGTALGDTRLMWSALKTNLTGMFMALLVSILMGLLWPPSEINSELLSRTDVGLDGIVLALASGAAAVLSLTTGLSSVLVGVMVAVALLPPTATMGIMIGIGNWPLAAGAALLLAVNIVCVNLSAKLVLLIKGVKPRTWLEIQRARQSMTAYTGVWIVTLILLILIITLRNNIG